MSAERKIDSKNIKMAALAAPILFAAAHFGCNTPNQKEPPLSPTQTSGQQDNPKTTPTQSTEQFGDVGQPVEPQSNDLIVKDGVYIYDLYPQMSLSDLTGEGELTKLANAIPSNFMTDIRASLTKAKDLEKQNAKDTAIWGEIQTTAQIVDINCQD